MYFLPQSSSHSSVHEWLQASGTAAPPPSPAESVSSGSSELQQVFASGAEAAMVVPPSARSSRMSRASRRSIASSLAMEMFGYSREMTSHVMQVVGQMQAQAQAQQDQAQDQLNQVMAQAEAQRADAKQRKEAQRVEAQAQRAEAMKREELALAREQMLARMKAETKEASQKREESIRSENLAREELLIRMKTDADRTNAERERVVAENEFKRQKMFVDTNAAIQREKMQADLPKDIEFQQSQQKLRELAAQELKERVHLERELVKQQQQNLILQKQREIDRLEAQADRNLFQQGQASSDGPAPKEKLATVQEEPATRSPEAAVVLTDSDTPPPSQNRPKPVRRPPIMIDVGIQECLVPVSEPLAVSTVSVSEGPMLDLATGVPLPTSHGPLAIPGGPVAAATPSHWLTRMWVKPCILRMPSPWVH